MIFDFTTRQPMVESGGQAPPPDPKAATLDNEDNRKVIIERPDIWKQCRHRKMRIDDVQRTVKCADCKMWLDPVWCLRELFLYYVQRVDTRIAEIKEHEKKEAERQARADARKKRPREYLVKRRRESLERAAYNRYQSELLAIRAGKQQATADRIGQELGVEKEEPQP